MNEKITTLAELVPLRKKMKEEGLDIGLIARITGLSIEEISKL